MIASKDITLSIEQFPFPASLSVLPIIHFWKKKRKDRNAIIAALATDIIEQVKKAPALLKPEITEKALEEHADLIELLMSAIFPPAVLSNELLFATAPFSRTSFYYTPLVAGQLLQDNNQLKMPQNISAQELLYQQTMSACIIILKQFYNVTVPADDNRIYSVIDNQTGLLQHFKCLYNQAFMRVKATAEPRSISRKDINMLLNNLHNLDLWLQYIEPHNFHFDGFTIVSPVDVTDEAVFDSLKFDLLRKDIMLESEQFDKLQSSIRTLFRLPQLRLGVAAFHKNRNTFFKFGNKICHSFIIQDSKGISCTNTFKAIYDKLIQDGKPIVIEDVTRAKLPADVGHEINRLGYKSIILDLIRYDEETIGILELGSPIAGDLSATSLVKMKQFLPLFAVAVNRNAEDLANRVQAVIKEKFTAIHPTVEWRFTDAAINLLHKREQGVSAEMEPIIFHDVYPLYGACDIHGSSTERNKSIQDDLTEHLRLANKVLKKALEYQPLPILDELKFLIKKHLRKLRHGLLSQDEVTIFESLKNEVEPMFKHLLKTTPELQPHIKSYWEALDPHLGRLYRRRKDFEQSMTLLNETISNYLESEEEKAQKMYPHYFQKYKTDGVEFTMYVGGSLVDHKPFDFVFLKNLRLWQFMIMCEICRKVATLQPQLKVPLQTTQLILVHSEPLSIRFRTDERQFDVDGAYNIRYEIIKKRVDKAVVQGSNERLVQPGKIAIIYTQNSEATEYQDYIDYLQKKELLTKEVEHLELAELQGVSGLKAIRVLVNFDKPDPAENQPPQEQD